MLVAVSGGVDSMVLLDIFMKSNIYFEILHINHQTRGNDNIIDLKCIKETIKGTDIKLHVYKYNHDISLNFQSEARKFRLETAKKIIEENKLDALVYAHHKDDQIENILMNKDKLAPKIMRETTFYEGILIYRPLLDLYKEQIYRYALVNNIRYNEDYSNAESKYKRNKYRNKVIKKLTNQEKEDIYQTERRYLKAYEMIDVPEELSVFDIINSPDKYGKVLLYKFIKKDFKNINVSNKFLNVAIEFIKKQKNGRLNISKKVYLVVNYQKIFIIDNKNDKIIEYQKLKKGINQFNGINFINKEFEGYVRVRKPYDRVAIKSGTKKVSRIFIDNKLNVDKRDRWPIVVNENDEIIWIPEFWRKREITK